jgi:DNA-binding MarR family transcriptional regulator
MTTRRTLPGAAADPERLAWWRAFDAAHARAESQLRRALSEQHDLSLAWFRVLDVLAQQSSPSVLGDVASQLGVPLSSLSRQIDRLETEELVTTRRGSADNHRHVLVQLTPAGKDLWKRSTTTVRQTLRRHVLADIDPAELTDEVQRASRVASGT